jgi:hypothetical protein
MRSTLSAPRAPASIVFPAIASRTAAARQSAGGPDLCRELRQRRQNDLVGASLQLAVGIVSTGQLADTALDMLGEQRRHLGEVEIRRHPQHIPHDPLVQGRVGGNVPRRLERLTDEAVHAFK